MTFIRRADQKLALRDDPGPMTRPALGDEEVQALLSRIADWAATRSDIHAVALVGSWARNAADAWSDVDLVVLVDDPEPYLTNEMWARDFGAASVLRTQPWGAVTERRLLLSSGLEVDVGIARVSWASAAPVEAGTASVVADGIEIIYDPEGLLSALSAVISG